MVAKLDDDASFERPLSPLVRCMPPDLEAYMGVSVVCAAITHDVPQLIEQWCRPRPGARDQHWHDEDIRPLLQDHFTRKWNLETGYEQAVLAKAIELSIELGVVPATITVPGRDQRRIGLRLT